MKLNTAARYDERTHEGAPAARLSPKTNLRRSVLSCLLWEREFYEDGQAIADRILTQAAEQPTAEILALAVEARSKFHLRHVPLLLLCAAARKADRAGLAEAVRDTIQRADELTELVAVYRHVNGRTGREKLRLPAQFKVGLELALRKFGPYALAKYDRDGAVKLRDVIRLIHPKPDSEAQAELWRKLLKGELESPDTWEVALSGGADKKATFERLLREGQLGYLALLRNLRNMATAGVDVGLVREALLARKGAERVLPFRYVAAARAAPQFEPYIDQALSEAVSQAPALSGRTVVLVDVSGSMNAPLSARSDLTRMDAACALASILPGDRRVFSFSQHVVEVPPRFGMAGVDALRRSQPHGSTYLGAAVQLVQSRCPHDRLIVITDEQSADRVPEPIAKFAYMVNVASAKNGVGYGLWVRISGFSEAVLTYIREFEAHDG